MNALARSIRRRLRTLVHGTAELCGGPLDGETHRVPRATAIGLWLPSWGAVDRLADGSLVQFWPYTSRPPFEETWPADQTWLGTYEFYAFGDAFVWLPTGLRSRSEVFAGFYDADGAR